MTAIGPLSEGPRMFRHGEALLRSTASFAKSQEFRWAQSPARRGKDRFHIFVYVLASLLMGVALVAPRPTALVEETVPSSDREPIRGAVSVTLACGARRHVFGADKTSMRSPRKSNPEPMDEARNTAHVHVEFVACAKRR